MDNARVTSCGRTYRERFRAIRGETSSRLSKRSAPLPTIPYISLDLRRKNAQADLLGRAPVPSWVTDGALPGVSSTPNSGECPNAAVESSLSSILEANAPEKYYLSARACLGILKPSGEAGQGTTADAMDALIEVLELDA